MAFADERTAIETRFDTQMAALFPDVPRLYDNAVADDAPGDEFFRLTIHPADARQITLGDAPLHRFDGFIKIAVFVGAGTGTVRARTLGDAAASVFKNAAFSGIQCRTPRLERVGEKNGWFQMAVTVRFWRDEVL